MKSTHIVLAVTLTAIAAAHGQVASKVNLQFHGYATQGFIYDTNNNWNTTNSTNGSASWTEAVISASASPQAKLRIGAQLRFDRLGDYGSNVTLDWAQVDFKPNDRFGIRGGKVKTPNGLLNESQDIDPAHLWALLPQSIYPIASRDTILAIYGGLIYGNVPLGERKGRVEFKFFGGQRVLSASDGFLYDSEQERGFGFPRGLRGRSFGASVLWKTPLRGLLIGGSISSEQQGGPITLGPYKGVVNIKPFTYPVYSASYERGKLNLAGEYNRLADTLTGNFPGVPTTYYPKDARSFYGMASYRLKPKLAVGIYYSSFLDRKQPVGSTRYEKDWTLSGRYDFSSYLYCKAEQHFIDGVGVGYSATNNSDPKPNDRMTLLKLGVSF